MTQVYLGRTLVLLAAVVAQPAIGQSNRQDAGRTEMRPQASLLLAAAETGAAGDASAADQGKKTGDAPLKPTPEGGFFRTETSPGFFGGSDLSRSLGPQSATAGYELRGPGADAGSFPGGAIALTAPVRGDAVRVMDGVLVYPSLSANIGYNDNVLMGPSNLVGSPVYNLAPGVVAEMKTHGDRYTLSYQGNYALYSSSSIDNYDHHDLFLAGDTTFTSRAHLGWKVGYLNNSDPRGATDRPSLPGAGPDLWHASVASGIFSYGAAQATGRVELETNLEDQRYLTNRLYTAGSDVNISMVAGRFFYRVMPKTSLLFEVRNTHYDYVDDILFNTNTERRYYAGVAWLATAATTGTLKLGHLTTSYEDPNHPGPGFSGASWEGSIRWAPLTYSTVDFTTSRSTASMAVAGLGSYILNTGANLMWNHQWASYISSRVAVGTLRSTYVGGDVTYDTKNLELGLFHDLSRRVRVGADWTLTDRSANQSLFAFRRNVLMFSIEGTL